MNPRPHFLTIPQLARRWELTEEDVIGFITNTQLDVWAFATVEDPDSGRSLIKLMTIGGSRDGNNYLWRYVVQREGFSIELKGDHRDGPDEPFRPGRRILHYSGKAEDLRVLMDEVERFEGTREPRGHRKQQIVRIRDVARELGLDLPVPPYGGKKRIKDRCLEDRTLFTPDGFEHAWKEMKKGAA